MFEGSMSFVLTGGKKEEKAAGDRGSFFLFWKTPMLYCSRRNEEMRSAAMILIRFGTLISKMMMIMVMILTLIAMNCISLPLFSSLHAIPYYCCCYCYSCPQKRLNELQSQGGKRERKKSNGINAVWIHVNSSLLLLTFAWIFFFFFASPLNLYLLSPLLLTELIFPSFFSWSHATHWCSSESDRIVVCNLKVEKEQMRQKEQEEWEKGTHEVHPFHEMMRNRTRVQWVAWIQNHDEEEGRERKKEEMAKGKKREREMEKRGKKEGYERWKSHHKRKIRRIRSCLL